MAKASDNVYPKVIITEGTAPSTPAAGTQKLFIDSADHKFKRRDSSGSVTIIEGGGSSATAPAVRDQTVASASASSITVAIPAATVAGDLLIAFVASGFTPSDTPPSGWQELAKEIVTPSAFEGGALFTRVAQAGDAGTNVTFNFSGSYACGGSIVAVSGASALQESSVRAVGTGTATTLQLPSTAGGTGFLTLVFAGARVASGTTTSSYGTSIATSTNATADGCVITALAAAGGSLSGVLITHSVTAKGIAGAVVKIRGT